MLSAPAILLNALAVGALRGFLDTTTPLYVVPAAFLLDYSLQPQWFAWMLPQKGTLPPATACGLEHPPFTDFSHNHHLSQ